MKELILTIAALLILSFPSACAEYSITGPREQGAVASFSGSIILRLGETLGIFSSMLTIIPFCGICLWACVEPLVLACLFLGYVLIFLGAGIRMIPTFFHTALTLLKTFLRSPGILIEDFVILFRDLPQLFGMCLRVLK